MAKKERKKNIIPPTETKNERFIRVVTPRVSRALKAISLIGMCTGSAYEYTDANKQKIFDALIDGVGAVKSKYDGKQKADTSFKM